MGEPDSGLSWVEAACTDWPGPIAHEYMVLKGMFAAMGEDRTACGRAERLDRTHLRLVKQATEAEPTFAHATNDDALNEHCLLWHGWYHTRALLELGGRTTLEGAANALRGYVLPRDLLRARAIHERAWLVPLRLLTAFRP